MAKYLMKGLPYRKLEIRFIYPYGRIFISISLPLFLLVLFFQAQFAMIATSVQNQSAQLLNHQVFQISKYQR